MSETKAEIGAGDVPITLTEKGIVKEFKLTCSLEAALALSKNNGLVGCMNRCLNYHFETIVDVYAAGLGKRSKELSSAIYNEGIAKCSIPAVKFLTNLTYGGRPPPKEEDGNDPLGVVVTEGEEDQTTLG